jgi:hypothetical protein
MASTPNYAGTPRAGVAVIATANANRDGTGTLGTVLTAGSSGSRVDTIVVQATGTTTAGLVRLFLHDGTSARLWREVEVGAVTPSGTVAAWRSELALDPPLLLPPSWSLRASTHNAETFVVIALGADF